MLSDVILYDNYSRKGLWNANCPMSLRGKEQGWEVEAGQSPVSQEQYRLKFRLPNTLIRAVVRLVVQASFSE
jgi:hypothetical protein